MSGRLLVAVNGGPRSASALDWSIRWAADRSMSLEVCTVIDDDWNDEDYPVMEKAHQALLDAAREHIAQRAPELPSSFVLHRGKLLDALVHLARHSDLLVVGSRKTAVLEGVIHGTLALKLAERVHSPLIAVPEEWVSGDGRVIVGVDDETDAGALEFAALASAVGQNELTLVHAVAEPVYYSPYDFGGRPELLQEMKKFSEQVVAGKALALRELHPGLRTVARVSVGNSSLTMVHAARGASLAVVGTHARGVVLGVLLGSVGRDLLMNMPCPIAIVPLATPESTDDVLALTPGSTTKPEQRSGGAA